MYTEQLTPGVVIAGRYEIIRPIGQGGMSVVYAAADLKLGRMLRAVKALKPGAPGGHDASLDELRVLQRIHHPRLPIVIDIVPPAGGLPLLLIMDYVEGETLTAAIKRAGKTMTAALAASIGRQLCDALAYLHELDPPIAHLDVKPSNLMMDAAGGIRLIDFGIAQQGGNRQRRPSLNLGTPGYAAPEQQAGGAVGPASDVYAAGALLHMLLAGGRLPEPDERRFDGLPPGVPAGLKDALASMLRRNAAERPSARESAVRLAAACGPAAPGAAIAAASPKAAAARPLTIGVASFTRGAGATFAAVMLAALLADEASAALIEHPANEPELLALLSGGAQPAPASSHAALRPVSSRHAAWATGPRLQLQALLGDTPPEKRPHADGDSPAAYAERLRFPNAAAGSGAGRYAVIDLSSGWAADPAAREAAASCDVLVIVADAQAQRWTAARRAGCALLQKRRSEAGLATYWLANRDASNFRARREWLAALPVPPEAVLPQLPPDQLLAWLWQGKRPDQHPVWRRMMEEALRPIVERVLWGRKRRFSEEGMIQC